MTTNILKYQMLESFNFLRCRLPISICSSKSYGHLNSLKKSFKFLRSMWNNLKSMEHFMDFLKISIIVSRLETSWNILKSLVASSAALLAFFLAASSAASLPASLAASLFVSLVASLAASLNASLAAWHSSCLSVSLIYFPQHKHCLCKQCLNRQIV